MKTSELFDELLQNLKVGGKNVTVAARRDEIAKALNKEFRGKDGATNNRLMVGSYGRHTAVHAVSDLDMIFIVPNSLRETYADENGPRRMLNRVRDALIARYPTTEVRVDQCVVRVQFTSNAFKFEVQPAFENDDFTFDYPDTVAKAWKCTKPRDEITATKECNDRTHKNMRHLARMVRAWKNHNGAPMGGLLIDTLVHRFFSTTTVYDAATTDTFDEMARDFFEFLKDEPEKDFYLALGSHQRVKVKGKFQSKAKKAHSRCVEAIDAGETTAAAKKWREVFGKAAPLTVTKSLAGAGSAALTFSTEEFIEDVYPVDISATVFIDCEVTQNGWRPRRLLDLLASRQPLLASKDLRFFLTSCDVPEPYELKWKVLNRGPEAVRRDCVRGQIIDSSRPGERREHTSFRGDHVVECFVLKDGIVVARDRIDVPIATTEPGN
ncbi:MAG: nucleotidyltransferase [Microbacterium sp. 71-36]|uniref:nucleotide-binding domain-containing protein n=1 Tax=unclassified Microbacterium TaxID=2609290 RepID=UPI00086A84B8|nr:MULTISPECIES: hypothetical protein [unclassified Microbacterium]MBN9212787.1 hypothetical protein [Microbacterium sp.]ODT36842.1 MAG: nucleotidyltransferase [Microbacterium sp. SCN 71-17]OJV74853.1 MAG: nucleotidyltransferase [Microbacterium sp. 71-36]